MTARLYNTAKKVAVVFVANIPFIVYNSAFIPDNNTRDILLWNFFDNECIEIISRVLFNNDVYPIVYSNIEGT